MKKTNDAGYKNKLPIPIYLISILLFLTSAYLIIGWAQELYEIKDYDTSDFGREAGNKKAEEMRLELENRGLEYNEANIKKFIYFGAFILIGFAILLIILGIGLIYRKNRARFTVITLSVIIAIQYFLGFFFIDFKFTNLAILLICILIALYFLGPGKKFYIQPARHIAKD